MNYDSSTDTSPEHREEFIKWLTHVTLDSFKQAEGDRDKLHAAVQTYIKRSTAASLDLEEIENILGVNEPSIMDLANLSEEDENIVVDIFEELINL